MRLKLAILLLAGGVSSAAMSKPADVRLVYKMTWNGLSIATVVDTLRFTSGGYVIDSRAESEGLAKAVNQPAVNRNSQGVYSELEGLKPERYERERDGELRISRIDREAGVVKLDNEGEMSEVEITHELVHDNLSLAYDSYVRAGAAEDLKFQLTDGRRLTDVAYKKDADEGVVSTGMGELRAQRLSRVTDTDRNYVLWLATEHDLLPALIQLERGGSSIVFTLLEISEVTDE